jgi:glycosyltransferase involved in cell wall biosynthesis
VVSLLPIEAFADDLARAGVPAYSLDMRAGRPHPAGLVRLARLLHTLRPHVLHAHLFHANVLARVARLICPVPVMIATIHSLAESSRAGAGTGARDRIYHLTGCLGDATVCVCRTAAERHGATRVIPNGVDTALFRPDAARRASTRQALGLGAEFVWLAAGRLMWKKDYPTLLEAFSQQAGAALLVAGEGPLEDELRALGGGARFLGARGDVPALMNAADGVVLSSVVEGLPMVLLEAASSGVPVVATDVGGVREAVLDGATGYVVPARQPEALARAMRALAALDTEARAAMGRAAREHAVAHFDLHAVAGQWEALYRELIERARRRSGAWM